MQVLPAGDVASKLLQSPAQLSLVCSSLQQCFAFDQAAAGLLLYAVPDTGPHLTVPAAQPEEASLEGRENISQPNTEAPAAPSASLQGSQLSEPDRHSSESTQRSLSAPMLPRLPAGLAHVGSQQCYEALAAVARSIGHVACSSGMPGCQRLPD